MNISLRDLLPGVAVRRGIDQLASNTNCFVEQNIGNVGIHICTWPWARCYFNRISSGVSWEVHVRWWHVNNWIYIPAGRGLFRQGPRSLYCRVVSCAITDTNKTSSTSPLMMRVAAMLCFNGFPCGRVVVVRCTARRKLIGPTHKWIIK